MLSEEKRGRRGDRYIESRLHDGRKETAEEARSRKRRKTGKRTKTRCVQCRAPPKGGRPTKGGGQENKNIRQSRYRTSVVTPGKQKTCLSKPSGNRLLKNPIRGTVERVKNTRFFMLCVSSACVFLRSLTNLLLHSRDKLLQILSALLSFLSSLNGEVTFSQLSLFSVRLHCSCPRCLP
ncbi:hypothetical protein TGP89_243520 [Toxoplasma gondii p89]|uniref:Uncharacterized protein n=1 Tax=Toxoplasma gondii p89 TaxID=943119 RepID=A0A086JQ89_TOXGO|nr:hypothetical protein TGP89_243520 [Toxoplasma gondii p89]